MTLEITAFIEDFELLLEEVDPGTILPGTIFRDIDEWSSLLALMLIGMADENYSVKLTGEDIRTSTTVADLYAKITGKL